MTSYLVAVDQGTTSTRTIVFRADLSVVASAQEEFPQYYPQSGWVEHEPEDLWHTTVATLKAAVAKAGISAKDIAGIGITNQRETTLVWDKATGQPVHRAIVWQDRRTADICASLKAQGAEPTVTAKTGLLLDPYFSASKIAWILDSNAALRAKAEAGQLLFGTVDTYLAWRLTGGKSHVTDATNASRTALLNIHTGDWDDELLRLFRVPRAMLPDVTDSAAEFGMTTPDILGVSVPIRGIAGDQQAATVGQGCFAPGMMKATYGTGCFALLNTGTTAVASNNRLLTTIAYQLAGQRTYALEGAIFVAGASVQWLRDCLGLIKHARETEALAASADPTQHVYLVPAFVGLAAPWWRPDVRAALFGMTRNTGPKELSLAALESVAYQTADLLDAMHKDMGGTIDQTVLRVDGGMVASDWTMQRLADILNAPVDRPKVLETTALGAAYLAGLQAGICPAPAEFGKAWALDRRFNPTMDAATRDEKRNGWADSVRRVL